MSRLFHDRLNVKPDLVVLFSGERMAIAAVRRS